MKTAKIEGIEISVELIVEQLEALGWTRPIKPVKPKVWVPEKDEYYFFVNVNGIAERTPNSGHGMDKHNIAAGNFFKTKKEAEDYRDRLYATQRVIVKLRELEGDYVADWNNNRPKYRGYYNHKTNKLERSYDTISQSCPAERYSTKEAWWWVVTNMETDVLLMLGVDTKN